MKKKPRVLLVDVETKPVKVWAWRTGKQYVNHSNIVEGEKFDIICICYKFAGEKTVKSLDWGNDKQDSRKMIEKFGRVVEKADVVIGHNGDNFDIKQINTQRLMHNLPPINWPTSEDTLKMLRKKFYLTSFSLQYVSELLFGAKKDPMCFQDWVDVVDNKDPKALKKMIKYCKKDVLLLEKVWERCYKYLDNKAHRGAMVGNDPKTSCEKCGSQELTKLRDVKFTRTTKKFKFACDDCKHVNEVSRTRHDAIVTRLAERDQGND